MVKNIIFDLDGVIVDSEPVHFLAHKKSLAIFGFVLTKEDYLKYGVARGDEFLFRSMMEKFGREIDLQKALELKRNNYKQLLNSKLKLRNGILELLKSLQGKYDLAVASSSRQETIKMVLERFELLEYFQTLAGGDDVKNVKPAPDIYLKTLKMLKANAQEGIAIEDSETGLLSAKAAGLKCIAAPTEFTQQHDFSKADFFVHDIKEIEDVVLKV